MLILFVLMITLAVTKSLEICPSNFCPPIIEKLKLTAVRELPGKTVGIDRDAGCICTEIPNFHTVCCNLKDKTTPCERFPKSINIYNDVLRLESTYIKVLTKGDFYNITHLKIMQIDGNQKLEYIEPFIFQNMTNLTTLSLIFNPLLKTLHPDTFQGLRNLKELNLVKNGFHSIELISIALKPSILPNLKKLGLSENVFKNVSEHDFSPMEGSNVEELSLVLCSIYYIHPKSLEPLKNLQSLRLGDNRFDEDVLKHLLVYSLEKKIDLKLLDLYSSGFRGFIPSPVLDVISKSNISYLDLTRNQFDVIDDDLFPIPMPNLKVIDLSDVSAQEINNISHIPNLITLIMGKNRLSYFSASKHLPNLTYLELRDNTNADGREFVLSRSEFSRMKLEHLDLQYTRLVILGKNDLGYMPHLRNLNFKNCSITIIEDDFFKGVPKLKVLNLENNQFFKYWMRSKFGFDIFRGLENLETLYLGGNDVTTIRSNDKYLLKNLVNLKHLGLNRNSLKILSSADFSSLKKLEILDVSENHIISWDSRVFLSVKLKEFYGSLNKISYLSDAMLEDFYSLESIKLDLNSFVCDCSITKKMSSNKTTLKKFKILIKNRQIFCAQPDTNETLRYFVGKILYSTLICNSGINMLLITIPSVFLLLLLVIIGIAVYIFRWHIRYWAFLVRLYLTRRGKIKNTIKKGYTNFQFDAFVSYCNKDHHFVLKLVKMLETQEPFLRLCVYERDFQVGSVISESVLEYITNSRKTVLIVSNAYAKSYWCNWETQIAEHHRLFFENPNGDCVDDSIVLIRLGEINEAHLNPTLKYLLKTRIYLQWDSNEEKQGVFWQRLKKVLTPPSGEVEENTKF